MSTVSPAAPRGPYANTPRRKAEIVDAAAHIFAESGYRGGSLRQIARDLDLSFTSVKHHFGSKENLLIAVLEANDELQAESLTSEWGTLSFVDSAMELARRNMEKPESLRLLAVLAAEASSPEHPAHDWFLDRYQRIRARVAEGIAADDRLSAVIDPASAAAALVSFWDGLQLQWLIDPGFDMLEKMRVGFEGILGAYSAERLFRR
jgi:AcrR family transcriptional regulator